MSQIPTQFEYLGRWHDTKHFRAFVYSATDQKLANNYTEFTNLVGSGLWFPTKAEALKVAESTPLKVETPVAPIAMEQKAEKIVPEEDKAKREAAKNKFRAATNLGK